jgi:hypothetical protein
MFCPECGHELQEGHAFCKYCGARLGDDAAVSGADAVPAEEPAAPPVAADTTLVAIPSGEIAPAAAGPPPRNNNTKVLLIIAAVVLGVLILAGAACALFVPARSETSTSDAGPAVTASHTLTPTSTASLGTGTTGAADTTTLTVPSYHPGDNTGTVPTTTPGGDTTAPQAYLENLDRLDSVLYDADGKMLAIADKINATTPNIPASVFEDLVTVGDDVMSSYDWLAADTAPAGYEKAHDLILQAGDAMITRIDKTKQGVIEIDRAGTTDAGLPFFAEAKTAKDQFTKLFAEYQQARP